MNYTQAQIDRANAVSLEDFLRTQGETLIKSGREYRWKEHDSLTVRGNKWFRHSQSKGGYPIDFVMEFYSYTVVDGAVYFRENSRMVRPDLNATAEARIKGMVRLRDCVQELIDLQMDAATPDSDIREKQVELNRLYDDFSAKYGLINDRANRLAFADDSSYYLLCALEIVDEDGRLERKADMFTKRTIKPHEAVTSVDTASEALAVSIAEKARVDMEYMEQLTGKTSDELAAELQGVIFRLPGPVPEGERPTYIAATGRVRGADDVIAYHVRQSFCPGEITPEEANRLGVEFAKRFTKGKHAFIVCTHIDKAHVHNHIIWSSVNLDCDRKFRNFWGSTRAVRRLSDTICIENGLSIVENPKPHGKSYDQWLGDQAKPSHRELLRAAIDNALAQKPADLDELLKLLRESGCEVSKRGKSYRLKLPGWGKVSRLDSLGDGYTLEDLLAVLAGQKEHTPRRKPVKQADPPKVNLLVDIQAKLQAGKGAGYARWAKVFNLKQMAQTVNYLTEHNLLEYAVLEEKAAAATAHHNELSAKIKVAEKRMAEIAVLRTHIINYAKTRDTYVAYRHAGYSKKFREEHEEEILLHQAAKNAFDDMGVKKLPKVKELQAEYARLLDEKKKTYAEYRRSREEMRELLAAKANVDRLLSMEAEHDTEREKDHGQR